MHKYLTKPHWVKQQGLAELLIYAKSENTYGNIYFSEEICTIFKSINFDTRHILCFKF